MPDDYQTRETTGRLFVYLHLSVWLFVFLLSVGAFVQMMPFKDNLLRAITNTLLLAALFYSVGYFYQRYYENRRYGYFALGLILTFLGITIIRYQINQQFSYQEDASSYYTPSSLSFFAGVVITNITSLLNSLLYQLVRSRIRMKERQTTLLAEQREAKIQFLRAQMNPHFLFNTMNNIYSLAVVRSEKTAPLVLRLSDLLRYVIYDAQDEKVPLTKEINVLEEYLELQQLQFENPKNISFDYDIPSKEVLIEPLLLIPLAENCFKHSDLVENEEAYVRLELVIEEQALIFIAENSYNPHQQQKDERGGVGLENIRRRLLLEYPGQHEFQQLVTENQFRIYLKIDLTQKAVI